MNILRKKTENIGVQVQIENPKPQTPVRKLTDTAMNKIEREKEMSIKPTTPNMRVAPKTPQVNDIRLIF